jgi:thymidylate synthase
MQVIEARNAHTALPELMYRMLQQGVHRESRNGPVVRIPGPCTIVYYRPQERVVFWPERAANPFFHLLEALWMLDGRNDISFVANIVPRMRDYSDDGITMHGAYGHRWRVHFGFDQIDRIAEALKNDPDDRRQVLTMWDPREDLASISRDLPCNTHAYFSRDADGRLDMMVCNRSNDSVWGALGSNVVHFSFLQELIAGKIGCPMGKYWQVSNNMHLYLGKHEELMKTLAFRAFPSKCEDPYKEGYVDATPLLPQGNPERFLRDLRIFLDEGVVLGVTDPFIRKVAAPMTRTLSALKGESPDRYDQAIEILGEMPVASDWQAAAVQWVEQKRTAWKVKNA